MPGGFRRKRARGDERVRVDGNGLRRALVGDAGLDDDALHALLERLDAEADLLERQRRLGWAAAPVERRDLRRIARLAEELRGTTADVVLLTDPETALGTRAILAALAEAAADDAAPHLHVVGAAEPGRFATLLDRIDWSRTLFVVASAGEVDLVTMGHFLVVRDRLLRELGAVAYRSHVLVVTSPEDGPLRQLVHDEGFRSVPMPEGVDARSVLSSAAVLVPLACAGIDVAALAAGGAAMLERCRSRAGARPAHLLAAALRLAAPAGLEVLPPATSALAELAAWIERCLAGEAPTAAGGATPPRRVGLVVDHRPSLDVVDVPRAYQDVESIGCVGGRTLGALAAHARDADALARWAAGELTVTITLPSLSAHVVGELIALTEAAAILAIGRGGGDETARATRLAWGLVGRVGYEAERAAAERLAALREDRYVA